MDLIYQRKYTITTNFFDRSDFIRPSSILDLAQHISGIHADILGCGFDEYISRGWIWVVVRNYIEVVKPVKNLQNITLKTYALKNMFVEMPRDVEYLDDEGNTLYKVRMIWMILDYKNNKIIDPTQAGKIYIDGKGLFQNRIRKISPLEKSKLTYFGDTTVKYSELDHNNHMNNSKYLDLFLDVYGEKVDSIKNYQVEYIKQCYYKDKISLYTFEEGNFIYLYGYKDDELKFYIKAEV